MGREAESLRRVQAISSSLMIASRRPSCFRAVTMSSMFSRSERRSSVRGSESGMGSSFSWVEGSCSSCNIGLAGAWLDIMGLLPFSSIS